jgi:hypothetical protein
MKRIPSLALLIFAFVGLAQATPLPTTQATEAVFNFNFTGQTPAPPYSGMGITLIFNGSFASPVNFDLFGGLNGQNFLSSGTVTWPGTLTAISFTLPSDPAVLDGVFSIGLYDPSAPTIDLNAVVAQNIGPQLTPPVFGTPADGQATVPEPGTLLMLGSGLVGLGWSRRRK